MPVPFLPPRFDPQQLVRRRPVVAVVRLAGVIAPAGGPVRSSLNLAALAGPLEHAFRARGLRAVALAVNSPGGSAVQSALIHDRIRQLANEKGVPVYAFCEDVAASGGYWLACAADEIYVNPSSIVGSIGVISSGFGLQDLIARLGVERRLHTAGEQKSFHDPFLPEKEEDVKRLNILLKDLHDNFKEHVRTRRGERLKGSDRRLFTGDFWTARRALDLGLVDGIADMRQMMRERFGENVRLRVVQRERNWLQRRLGISGTIDAELPARNWSGDLISALETRSLWSRYGL